MTVTPLPFIDLDAQRRRLGPRLEEAVLASLRGGRYILGPEVSELETKLADFCGARHAVTCSNGTDALAMVLMALDLKPGDAVLCPAFTFAATAEVIAWLGATPVFCDVRPDTFNLDPDSVERGIATAKALGLRPACLVPVDLFGQPADYDALRPIAEREGMFVLADAAQSLGGEWNGRRVGTFGGATSTSFFPAKPLGCYGDGGAIFTEDDTLAETLRSIRVHGQGRDKYDNTRIGMNGRLDTLQAAVLLAKLEIFEDELAARQTAAARYADLLGQSVTTPAVDARARSAWAQYTLVLPGSVDRDAFQASLKARGVPTAIYYPRPLNRQTAYAHFPSAEGGTPVSAELADRVVSLPMHPYLDAPTQERIAGAVVEAVGAGEATLAGAG